MRISTFLYDRVVCRRPIFPLRIIAGCNKNEKKKLFEHIREQHRLSELEQPRLQRGWKHTEVAITFSACFLLEIFANKYCCQARDLAKSSSSEP